MIHAYDMFYDVPLLDANEFYVQVNVSDVAQVFLDYIMNNHHVSPEPEMILQAFKISLVRATTSFLLVLMCKYLACSWTSN